MANRTFAMFLSWLMTLLTTATSSAAVTVTPVPCGLTLTCTPIANAAIYRVSRVYASCQNALRRTEFIADSASNEYLLTSNPAFTGMFTMEAIGPNGGSLGIQESDIGTPLDPTFHPATGAPWIPVGASTLAAWVGERIVISVSDVPTGAMLQWTRNGLPIAGATSTQLDWLVGAEDAGAVFAPTLSNSCGTHVGVSRTLLVAPAAPPSGAIEWLGIRRTVTSTGGTCVASCGSPCCTQWTTTVQLGWPASPCIQPFADGFRVNCTVPGSNGYNASTAGVSRLRFYVPLPSIMTLSGTNSVSTMYFGNVPCGSVFGSITGPVNATLPTAVGSWGPITLTLPVGEYLAEIRSGSSGSCPSGSSSTCTGSSVMDVTASIAPIPYMVPISYPTIQAAIDAVPADQARVITVAPGVYRESFALNGRNVVILGAPGQGTILDGVGLATSIARFTGNEPATAGVENLVFRGGTSGSLAYPDAPFDVGGAIYGSNTSAFIRGCRFESCSADYGGAVYLINSRSTVTNCAFDDNTAINEGGGLFLYECTSVVSGSSFTNNDVGLKAPGAGSAFKAVGARATGEVIELTGCTFSGNRGLLTASAIEYYENVQSNPGVLRISGCTVTANVSGVTIPDGAAGLRVLGRSTSCLLTGGTSICSNAPRNVSGPFLIQGSASVCDCLADVTGDGVVNAGDLGTVLGAWGPAGPLGTGDVTHDGMIDAFDIAALLSAWGSCN